MSTTSVLALTFGIGVIAGLRSLTAPAVVSWAARLHWIFLVNTWAVFLEYASPAYIFAVLALAELVNDKLPTTPSRTTTGPFVARIMLGAFSGAALCASANQSAAVGAVFGALGAVAGTLGGYEARTRLVRTLRAPDLVIAVVEDAVAVGGGLFVVSRF
jgi:uncharacterized membrane protein